MSHTPPIARPRSQLAYRAPIGVTAAFLFTLLSAASAQAAAPKLVVADGVVAWVEGPRVRIYDFEGRRLAELPPANVKADDDLDRARRGDRTEAYPTTGSRMTAREAARVLDEHGLSGADRDDDVAEEIVEEELPLRLRRASGTESSGHASRDHEGGEAPWPAWASAGGDGLWVGAGHSIWRVQAGRPPLRVGRAPLPAHAAAVVAQRWLVLAGDQVVVGHEGRGFRPLPLEPPLDMVADRGTRLALHHRDRIDVVTFATTRAASLATKAKVRFVPPASVQGMAFCANRLFALTTEGLVAQTSAGDLTAIDLGARGTGIVCSGERRVVFGHPGLRERPGRGDTTVSDLGVAIATARAAAFVGDTLWLVRAQGLLVRIAPSAEKTADVREIDSSDRSQAAVPADDEAPITSAAPPAAERSAALAPSSPGRRSTSLPQLLPELAVVGQIDESSRRRRALGLSVVANWRLGRSPQALSPLPERDLRTTDPVDMARLANTPTGPTPQGGSPGAFVDLGPDRDAGCLHATRQRAVALASAEAGAAQSLVTRAGRSAWLPELRLRAERRVGRSESVDFKPTAANDALGLDTVSDVRYEVRAIWDLPRLVFNPEELAAHQQAARIADMRREIESQVNRLYFERRRLLALPPATAEEVPTWQVRLEEIEADLDALSSGGFSRCRAGLLQPRASRS